MMYMASEGQDYSILAETFLNIALLTQTAMDQSADLLEALASK